VIAPPRFRPSAVELTQWIDDERPLVRSGVHPLAGSLI
jgi:hypothetical protein